MDYVINDLRIIIGPSLPSMKGKNSIKLLSISLYTGDFQSVAWGTIKIVSQNTIKLSASVSKEECSLFFFPSLIWQDQQAEEVKHRWLMLILTHTMACLPISCSTCTSIQTACHHHCTNNAKHWFTRKCLTEGGAGGGGKKRRGKKRRGGQGKVNS